MFKFRKLFMRRAGIKLKRPPLICGTSSETGITAAANAVGFHHHLSRYRGQTVTIFTSGGGISGRGFTGVILNANITYITLLARVGPAPMYCSRCYHPACNLKSLGALMHIPLNKIAAFVHNSIRPPKINP